MEFRRLLLLGKDAVVVVVIDFGLGVDLLEVFDLVEDRLLDLREDLEDTETPSVDLWEALLECRRPPVVEDAPEDLREERLLLPLDLEDL